MLSSFLVWTLQYLKKKIAPEKLKKPPSKVAEKNSNWFFPYCPELSNGPNRKKSCSKMWLIDQLTLRFWVGNLPPPGSDSHDYLFLSSITIKTNLVIGLFSILGMDVMVWLIEEEKLTPVVDQTMYSSLFPMCIRLVLS